MTRRTLGALLVPATAVALVAPLWATHTAIGFTAGASGAAAVYPVDFVKTQRQTASGKREFAGLSLPATLIHMVNRDGPLSVFRGLGVQVAGVAPEKAIKLTVNDAARSALHASFGSLSFAGELAAGVCAGACQVVVTNPLECVKVRLQTTKGTETAHDVVRSLGFEGLSTGAVACAMRDASFSAILFPTYAHAKILLPELLQAAHLPGAASLFLAGVLSAAPAAFLTTPLDVIKTRQLEHAFADRDMPSVGEVTRTLHEEGVDTLFSGSFERVLRSAPQFGVTLALYDVLTQYCTEHGWL
jgi:solute carrier family 25 aspartate/glutamate transporter 12/13